MSAGAQPGSAWADTNLFVSLFADASHPLHEQSLSLFRRVADGSLRLVVTPVVVAEMVYVLESVLGWRRATVAARLAGLLMAEGLDVREADSLSRALELYRTRSRLDFVDAYLAACALVVGPPRIASLDRDFDRLEDVHRVSG